MTMTHLQCNCTSSCDDPICLRGSFYLVGRAHVVVPPLFRSSHVHVYYIPLLLLAGSQMFLVIEWFAHLACKGFFSFSRAIPFNIGFVLHRCTELFMV